MNIWRYKKDKHLHFTKLANNLSTQALGRLLEELRASQDIQLRSFDDVRKDASNATQ